TVLDATARFNRSDLQPLLEQCAQHVFPIPVPNTSLGYVASDTGGRRILCVPLSHDPSRVLALAVVDPALALLEMGELLGALLRAIWNVDVINDPVYAEARVLTALRSAFGRLPLSLYDRCFSLYQQLIASLVMVFQPVISLDKRPQGIGIHSYEELARR